jgi:hypothetical protein
MSRWTGPGAEQMGMQGVCEAVCFPEFARRDEDCGWRLIDLGC